MTFIILITKTGTLEFYLWLILLQKSINILLSDSKVIRKLYSITGEEIRTLINDQKGVGLHSYSLDGSDLSSGVYFCTFEALCADGLMQYRSVKKISLLK